MNCWKCNSPISEESSYCSFCGAEQNRNKYCPKCGAEMLKDASFCMRCGTASAADNPKTRIKEPQEKSRTAVLRADTNSVEKKQPPKLKSMANPPKTRVLKCIPIPTLICAGLAMILAAALLITNMGFLSGSSSDTSIMSSGKKLTFSTPEKAIQYFVDCIKEGDTKGALQSFAISEKANGFDFEKDIEKTRQYQKITSLSPANNSYYYPLNEGSIYGTAAHQVAVFSYSFLLPEEDFSDATISLDDLDESVSELEEKILDTSKLGNLILEQTVNVYDCLQNINNIKSQDDFVEQAKVFGADDIQEFVALYELDGKYFFSGFQMIDFDGSWKINCLYSTLANENMGDENFNGSVREISEDDFQTMVDAIEIAEQ